MDVASNIKFLPNIYAGDDDYEERFDESLIITRKLQNALFAPSVLAFPEIP